jgi:oligoribonuclease NrnB/cAMP/cGMP phosphodiesterase (DHH superfamily)
MNKKNILFTDIAPIDEVIEQLLNQECQIQILDHHITSKDRLVSKSYAIFDMELSGVGLTWNYFYPDLKIPLFLAMLQDQDLWKFNIIDTREFFNGFIFKCQCEDTFEDKFKLMDGLLENPISIQQYIDLGIELTKHKTKQINNIVKKIKDNKIRFNGYDIIMYNCTSDLTSELGNALSKEFCDFAVLWTYDHIQNKYLISLRSCKGICADIAKNYLGGGGHPNAAGGSSSIHPNILFRQN